MTTLRKELEDIPWESFSTAYGKASDVPSDIEQLFSQDPEIAKGASHRLWCGLCHQHAFISSAALPALPFLLQALRTVGDELKVEVLDILAGFALCSKLQLEQDWAVKLRQDLMDVRALFEDLSTSGHPEVAEFAQWVCEELCDDSCTQP